MKKYIAVLIAVCMVFALCACTVAEVVTTPEPTPLPTPTPTPTPSPEPEPEYEPVYVLYTNDVHCAADSGVGYDGITYVRQALRAIGGEVLLADCGDFVHGGLIGTLSDGAAVIDMMNRAGYDVAVPGNHEFGYGMNRFFELVNMAEFPVVSANFTDDSDALILAPYVIIERGGRRIAFVGATTPETFLTANPRSFMDEEGNYVFGFCQDSDGQKLYDAVQSAVDAARYDGADTVIVLAHLGIELQSSPWTSGELITNTTGIDAVLDGHSHSVIEQEVVRNADGEEVILSSTGTGLQNLGCLVIDSEGRLSSYLINSAFDAVLADAAAEIEDKANEVVAHTDVDLCIADPATGERMVRQCETNLGDLCADAYRAITGAQIAMVNAGNVRAAIPAGDITYGQIINVSPFSNEVCVAEVTGQELLDALEVDVSSLPGERGGFPQVSGIAFTVDVSIPSSVTFNEIGEFVSIDGERRVRDVTVNGEPLDPEQVYSLASVGFVIKDGGDGQTMFRDNKLLIDGGKLDNQVLIEYITDVLGSVGKEYADPYGDGRITIIE